MGGLLLGILQVLPVLVISRLRGEDRPHQVRRVVADGFRQRIFHRPRSCPGLAVAVISLFPWSSNLSSAENLSDGGEFLRHVLVVPVEVSYELADLRDQLLPFGFACAR